MRRYRFTLFFSLLVISSLFSLSGCSSSSKKALSNDTATATIHFLRPNTIRPMGFMDNKLLIEIDKQPRLKLKKRSSASIELEPEEYLITLRYKHVYGAKNKIKETFNERWFTFKAGKNYYLVLKSIDEEFRGGYFEIESVDQATFQSIKDSL